MQIMNVSPIKIALHVNMETYEIALVNIVCCDRYLLQFIQTSPPYLVQLESSLSIFALCSVQSFHLRLGQADEKVKRHIIPSIHSATNKLLHPSAFKKKTVAGYFSPHFHRHLLLLLLSSTNFDDNLCCLLNLDTALWFQNRRKHRKKVICCPISSVSELANE